jgi:hypothetical protein
MAKPVTQSANYPKIHRCAEKALGHVQGISRLTREYFFGPRIATAYCRAEIRFSSIVHRSVITLEKALACSSF